MTSALAGTFDRLPETENPAYCASALKEYDYRPNSFLFTEHVRSNQSNPPPHTDTWLWAFTCIQNTT